MKAIAPHPDDALSWRGMIPCDLAALLCGVKPVACCAPPQDGYREIARRYGLRRAAAEGACFLGREPALLELARRLWSERRAFGERWSIKVLGYPPCCVARFERAGDATRGDPVLPAARRAQAAAPWAFVMNNVLNFSARLHGAAEHRRFAAGRRRLRFTFHVLPWHPCAYDCAPSLAAAARIWSALQALSPEFCAQARRALARRVLFWSPLRFAFLEGDRAVPELSFGAAGERANATLLDFTADA